MCEWASIITVVDGDFQESVQKIFGIDKVTNKGKVPTSDDEKADVGVVEYMRGPVKLIERARVKAQNDYAKESFPSSACVLDFNRCALVFDDISTLLQALQLFVNKVKYYQSGNIIAIARDKNGFIEYVKEAQYADIKLNVVIKGKHNSIIGEVQFLLRAMKEYKDKAHNLYAIQRKEEAIRTSVSATLPLLLNEQKEILRNGCYGKEKGICKILVLQNKSIKDLMFVDKESGNNILHRICTLGHLQLFLFLKSMLPRNEFIEHIFLSDIRDVKPIEYAIRNSNASIVKNLVNMTEVRDRYKDNDAMIFRLCYFLFVFNSNQELMQYVLSVLQITKEKVCETLSYKCPKQPGFTSDDGAHAYHMLNILVRVSYWGTFAHLERLVAFLGKEAFVENVFNLNGWNFDVMKSALRAKRMNVIEYVLSFEAVRNKYLSDGTLLFRLVTSLNQIIEETEIVKYVIDAIGLTTDKLKKFKFRNADIEKICLSLNE